MSNLAVLDLGSSSFHLLVTSAERRVHTEQLMVRLGARTLQTGVIDEDSWQSATAAIDSMVTTARAHGARRIVAVATSALREARNGGEFAAMIADRHGFRIEILDLADEARLIYRGVRAGLPRQFGRVAVVDLGGGSVGMAVGGTGDPALVRMLPLGVLRLRESIVPESGHVSERVAEAITDLVRATAREAVRDVRAQAPEVVVFSSGTARTLARLARDLAPEGPADERLSLDNLRRLVRILAKLRPSSLADLGVEEGRTDTIAPGAVVMTALTELLGFPSVLVSERALRDGVAERELARGRGAREHMLSA
jgi:exopolyphosphatase/guanosine-5'-triphosphate,3'-diphosphate pyrophosphatase